MSAIPAASSLLAWYDRNRRSLPWRTRAGASPHPYHVWLSEIMLQQTTVAAVIPYFSAFLARFPTVQALAAAPAEAVMAAWAGLGYYARARQMHKTARILAATGFPCGVEALARLPGIGPYTAAAIAAIAFGQPVVAVDGNVERVLARLHGVETPLPAARPELRALAPHLMADPAARGRAGDFAQALFDLGATVCTPRAPHCPLCPWQAACRATAAGDPARLPRRQAKPPRPRRWGVHFWLTDAEGRVLLRTRPPCGLLGGMAELPGTPWRTAPWREEEALALAPIPAPWREIATIGHGFTHFTLEIRLFAAQLPQLAPEIAARGFLRPVVALGAEALPSVMRKCARAAVAPAPPALLGGSRAPSGA